GEDGEEREREKEREREREIMTEKKNERQIMRERASKQERKNGVWHSNGNRAGFLTTTSTAVVSTASPLIQVLRGYTNRAAHSHTYTDTHAHTQTQTHTHTHTHTEHQRIIKRSF